MMKIHIPAKQQTPKQPFPRPYPTGESNTHEQFDSPETIHEIFGQDGSLGPVPKKHTKDCKY